MRMISVSVVKVPLSRAHPRIMIVPLPSAENDNNLNEYFWVDLDKSGGWITTRRATNLYLRVVVTLATAFNAFPLLLLKIAHWAKHSLFVQFLCSPFWPGNGPFFGMMEGSENIEQKINH